MAMQCLLEPTGTTPASRDLVDVRLRFLQLQVRSVERLRWRRPFRRRRAGRRRHAAVLSWDEAVECEVAAAGATTWPGSAAGRDRRDDVEVRPARTIEPVADQTGTVVGRIVRRRSPLGAAVTIGADADDGLVPAHGRASRTRSPTRRRTRTTRSGVSLIGTHLLVEAAGARGSCPCSSPPRRRRRPRRAAGSTAATRCSPGRRATRDVVLGSPIILYDYPEIAEQSAGALFDSTEIDEILTLRVMTMTDEEKAEARATDPRAAEIIDRCDEMSPETLQQLHGVLRDPHGPLDRRAGRVRNLERPLRDRRRALVGSRRRRERAAGGRQRGHRRGAGRQGQPGARPPVPAGPTPRTCSSPTRSRG